MKKVDYYQFFYYVSKMSHKTNCYQKNKEKLLNRAKEIMKITK